MAGIKFGSVTPAANTDTTLCTITTGASATMTINICNTNSSSVTINITVGGDKIEYGTSIHANGVLERTALIAVSGEAIVVNASASGVTFRAYGIQV
jgi:hypothetical protein